jgi:hypothetical protein
MVHTQDEEVWTAVEAFVGWARRDPSEVVLNEKSPA